LVHYSSHAGLSIRFFLITQSTGSLSGWFD
jgi:hypothetical protein